MSSLDDFRKRLGTKGELSSISRTSLSNLKTNNKPTTNLESRINALAARAIKEVAEEIRNNLTELIIIIDDSTSMEGTEYNTIKGFEYLVNNLKAKPQKVLVTVVSFSDCRLIDNIYDREDIKNVGNINLNACGNTALYDAVGKTINNILEKQKEEGENKPKHTLVSIITDGEDNDSRVYDASLIRNLIDHCKKLGWEFILLANGLSAKNQAGSLGVDFDKAVNYEREAIGTNFKSILLALESMQKDGKIKNSDWAKPILEQNKLLSSSNNTPRLRLGGK